MPTLSRRKFLRYTTAAGLLVSAGPYILRGQSPNSKLNVGVIGAGGKGESDMDGVAGQNIYAICDIDEKTLQKAAAKYPQAKLYRDYREMLEKEKNLDLVTVSTPDHHHAPASMMAIKLGKHVYCQKPLTHSIYEARMLTLAAREHKVATQMGNQGHSSEGVRSFAELIWAGAIGPVTEMHCWTNRPIWPQGMGRPEGVEPVPAHIDWDLFLGPAPERPYHSGYHPFAWRGFWDFGTGALGDMACHIMDPANFALKLAHPISVEATSSEVNNETAPKWAIITYQFPARGEMPPVKLIWHDGGKQPARELLGLKPEEPMPDNGSLFIGKKGKMIIETYGGNPRFTADSETKDFPTPPKTIPRVSGHYSEFIEACKGGKPAGGNFDYAGPFTEIVLLGNLAVRSGKKVNWDGASMQATNAPELAKFIKREYRKGWQL